jgi:uncharacterized protein YndB with AHSA1/START domain
VAVGDALRGKGEGSLGRRRRPGRGRIYEIWDDGQERDWGTVLVWERPQRVVYSWQPNPDRPAPTEVEVRIVPDGDGDGDGARLELEHRGWERLGEAAEESHSDYDRGWNAVLGAYGAATSTGA